MKYAFIYRNKRVWPIRVQCRVLRVSVAGRVPHTFASFANVWDIRSPRAATWITS